MARVMADIMPLVMAKMGPQGMARMVESMGAEQVEGMMVDVLPGLMDSCFASMDADRRRSMLAHCRAMLDDMEARQAATGQSA
jgi:hypothetical protein